MIPQTVKKIDISKLKIKKYGDYPEVPTKLLAELNITENEPFQIIDKKKGAWDGKWGIVQEFWVRDWQTFYIIPKSRLDYHFTNLFKASQKKKEYMIMEKKYEFTPQTAFVNIETHMKLWAKQTNAKNFIVGISGGKDSTVVAMLLCAIFGKERVWGVQLPQDLQKDYDDAKDVINILGINHYEINVGYAVGDIECQFMNQRKSSGVYPTKDMEINLPARIRMAALHAVGQCVDGRVINTSNLSEDMVGYATQFGDNAGAYAPLQGLTVTEVMQLGDYLAEIMALNDGKCYTSVKQTIPGASKPRIPKPITGKERIIELIHKTPADGLQAQSDEERLGFTYVDLDKFIRCNEGSDEFKEMIRKKYKQNNFKLEIVQMPQPDFTYLPNFVKAD